MKHVSVCSFVYDVGGVCTCVWMFAWIYSHCFGFKHHSCFIQIMFCIKKWS